LLPLISVQVELEYPLDYGSFHGIDFKAFVGDRIKVFLWDSKL
jgi:hypothetical protein